MAAIKPKGEERMKSKIREVIGHVLFVAGFIFVASGMLEAVVLKLLGLAGW